MASSRTRASTAGQHESSNLPGEHLSRSAASRARVLEGKSRTGGGDVDGFRGTVGTARSGASVRTTARTGGGGGGRRARRLPPPDGKKRQGPEGKTLSDPRGETL